MTIKKLFAVPLFVLFALTIAPIQAVTLPNNPLSSLENRLPGEFGLPGTIRDTAKHFSITNSEYLNISIDHSQHIKSNI